MFFFYRTERYYGEKAGRIGLTERKKRCNRRSGIFR